MEKLSKGLNVIRKLSAVTPWPVSVTPMSAESDGTHGFWPAGFSAGAVSAAIRYERKDLMLLVADAPASAAALFTTNLCCAAPVTLSRKHLQCSPSSIRAIVCNSGNANAATGEKGMDDSRAMAQAVARELLIRPEEVLVASTGVIGQLLPMERVLGAISILPSALQRESGIDAAQAIMTTDTFPKFFTLELQLSGGTVRLSGIAKGSGMICPNMATMLAILATDASIAPALLQKALKGANRKSFNAITVDGDTSTNDMVSILASGTGPVIMAESKDFSLFCEALEALMTFLAKLIVIDGEGATKLVTITVEGAVDDRDAELAARTIAQSSLVKTAIHGEDPNWGRIVAAAGRSGAFFHQEELELHFDNLSLLKPGFIANYSETAASEIMAKESYTITLRLGSGPGQATVWSCDLSKEYVDINGSYRS
ncbi:bifunctional glutamate N-acetyltransferase/amino-acid acetyltransferase ArgJ [Pelodictyon phaeoclathratiforme]|uniref:Arginine biosynthesis bifunctional protein ArgJ n=1 Tax=Pelodictyon phaeoclathratiforme (strain DSM 5477 / BU-1) TaxID=324925 RepID=B4S9U9_PELPB|nr:arginine biosynthesis bifunctional protein ArgJ [Pelodictyon phaeoclathratiforme BU-1]